MTEVRLRSTAVELPGVIASGTTVAIGGVGTSRKPMALVRALVDAGIENLTVISMLGSVDVELLLAAGAVRELHAAAVAVDGVGMAPLYRAARQSGRIRVVEWSEGSLCAALEAGARGLPSMPCATSPESDVVRGNDWLLVGVDPFTGERVVHARAVTPDVALLHVPDADGHGNLFIDGDPGADPLLAYASSTVLATADRVTVRTAREATVSRIWVDAVFESPRASCPTASYPHLRADLDRLGAWVSSGGTDAATLREEG